MLIKNISTETQTGVETGLYQIGMVSVAPNEVIQVDDSVGDYLTKSYSNIYIPILQLTPLTDCFQGVFNLIADLPTPGEACWFAIVNETDTVWYRDTSTNTWIDTGVASSTEQTPETFTATAGQTLFTLSNVPLDPDTMKVFLNGQHVIQGYHYTVAGANITWLDVPVMAAGRLLTVYYM